MSSPVYNLFGKQAAFVLLDGEWPEHIKKTFRIMDGKLNGYIPIVRQGEMIPDKLRGAIIIYHNSDYHAGLAANILTQLNDLNPGIHVLGLIVEG